MTLWEALLMICLFFSGFAARALYESIRDRGGFIKKKRGAHFGNIVEYKDGKYQIIKED